MKIIYCGNGEIATARVAGLIHLQKLPPDRIPSQKEIETAVLPDLSVECGIPAFLGKDAANNQIYIIDLGKVGNLAFLTIAGIIAGSEEQWSFRDLSPVGNHLLCCGRILRRIGMAQAAQRVTTKGIQSCYFQLARFVFKPDGLYSDSKKFVTIKQS